MAATLNCRSCGATLEGRHLNARFCKPCGLARRQRPPSNLTDSQGAQLLQWRNQLTHQAMAERLGVSAITVKRYFKEQGLSSNSVRYPREVVETVLAVYAQHGRHRTQDLFPEVRVRCIVERYKPADTVLRQQRWQEHEIIEAARMAGLVSAAAQARYFQRPNASNGSIVALWNKVFQCAPRNVNGLGAQMAFQLVRPGTPCLLIKHKQNSGAALKVLWLHMVGQLRADCPAWIKHAIEVLARFQAWLHQSEDPHTIMDMIDHRESAL